MVPEEAKQEKARIGDLTRRRPMAAASASEPPSAPASFRSEHPESPLTVFVCDANGSQTILSVPKHVWNASAVPLRRCSKQSQTSDEVSSSSRSSSLDSKERVLSPKERVLSFTGIETITFRSPHAFAEPVFEERDRMDWPSDSSSDDDTDDDDCDRDWESDGYGSRTSCANELSLALSTCLGRMNPHDREATQVVTGR